MVCIRFPVVAALGLGLINASHCLGQQAPQSAGSGPPPARAIPPQVLRPGDAAPRLAPLEWLKGDPVDFNDGKQVYVVEFWATWCRPCLQQMPYLKELQEHYKQQGLVVVALNSGDREVRVAKEFVAKHEGSLVDRVAFDGDRVVWNQVAAAAGFQAIPLALVIDRSGRIAYLDHPQHGLEVVVERVIKGTWDPVRDKPPAPKRAMIAGQVRELVKRRDFVGAFGELDRISVEDPELAGAAGRMRFKIAYFDQGDFRAAMSFAEQMLSGPASQDPEALADVAEWMINEAQPDRRDFALAARVAARAVELTSWKDGAIIDILARCTFHQGDLEKAVELQARAVEAMSDGQGRRNLAETLRLMRERLGEKNKTGLKK